MKKAKLKRLSTARVYLYDILEKSKGQRRNQTSNSQRFAVGDRNDCKGAEETFRMKEIFSILIVVLLHNCIHLSKVTLLTKNGEFSFMQIIFQLIKRKEGK